MEQTIINKTDKPKSLNFRSGGAGSAEWKIYFNTENDLYEELERLANSERVQTAMNALKTRGAQ